tara:strand:- start:8609 stop:9370 length:762 start_codon:yes stop_codon:yes gene_type:complete
MKNKIIAANWKMNKDRDEAIDFIFKVNEKVKSVKNQAFIFAPSIFLRDLIKRVNSHIKIGAQNMYHEEKGAYTGEISYKMLKSYNIFHVLIGHSERRNIFNETDADVNKKILSAISQEIKPIVCVGESLEERKKNLTNKFISEQIEKALLDVSVDKVEEIIFAYEPLWAIGTGVTASHEEANNTIKMIRNKIRELYNDKVSENINILYGGSVNNKNIDNLLTTSDIDGVLVGGASLDPENFIEMVKREYKKRH